MALQRLTPDSEWAAGLVASLPALWQRDMLGEWKRQHTRDRTAGNLGHLRRANALEVLRIPLDATDGELIAAADTLAHRCFDLGTIHHQPAELAQAMGRVCQGQGIEPPDPHKTTPQGAIARMTSPMWWRRRIRRHHGRAVEKAAIDLGRVNKNREIYASNQTCDRRAQQSARNAATLESTIAVNELGQEFTLAELAAKGPANKAIKRAELMTRIAGFERIARDCKHEGLMATLTCSSRMHKWRTAGPWRVEENPKYDGTSPREANEHLGTVWARIRSALARCGVKLYGFRIAEPQHDGTPHWHMLVFHDREWQGRGNALALPRIAAIMRRYALGQGEVDMPDFFQQEFRRTPYRYKWQAEEAAELRAAEKRHTWRVEERRRQNAEPGAKEHRADFVPIDWTRGSAAGYIAKYIAKNIDGYAVEKDLHGNPTFETTQRVEAWATTWGIRQFQQVGGPPVGPWREMRRVKELLPTAPEPMLEAWQAVNKMTQHKDKHTASVSWDRYVRAQGGVFCGRKYLVRVAMRERPGMLNVYGEQVGPVPCGVEIATKREIYQPEHMAHMGGQAERVVHFIAESVRHTWELKRAPQKVLIEGVFMGMGAARAPWTCVNNCTEGVFNGHGCNENGTEKSAFRAGGGESVDRKAGNPGNGASAERAGVTGGWVEGDGQWLQGAELDKWARKHLHGPWQVQTPKALRTPGLLH